MKHIISLAVALLLLASSIQAFSVGGLREAIKQLKGSSSAAVVNNKPIIGIFAQPSGHTLKPFGDKYIAASYVKYIESAGARVVPIPYDLSQSELRTLFESLNGALFPGGGTDLTNNDGSWTPYLKSLGMFVKWSMEAYDQNQDYFPIWGTCLGMQSITIILSNDPFILGTGFDSYNISMPLNFTNSLPDTQRLSRIFNSCPYSNMNTLATKAVTLNNHHDGVDVATWFKNDKLTSENLLISTNKDRKGREFISLFENKRYPIYASQFHPEKIAFEWCHEDIDHSFDSLVANQYFGQFLVNEARKSMHQFKTEQDELKALIYNYTPTYTYPVEPDFVQCYFFN